MYGYVSVRPIETTSERNYKQDLVNLVKACGIIDGVVADKLHVTVAHDETNPISETMLPVIARPLYTYDAEIIGVRFLGKDTNDLVLLLESPSLEQRHHMLRGVMDFSYPDYIPHMTVKYDATDDDLNSIIELMPLIKSLCGDMILGEEVFEPIKDRATAIA